MRQGQRTGVAFFAAAWILLGVALALILLSKKWPCVPASDASSARATFVAMLFALVAAIAGLIVAVPASRGRKRLMTLILGLSTIAALVGAGFLAAGHTFPSNCGPSG